MKVAPPPPFVRTKSSENILMSLCVQFVIRLGNGYIFISRRSSFCCLSSLNTFLAFACSPWWCGGPHKLSPPPNYFFIFRFLRCNLKLSHQQLLFSFASTPLFFYLFHFIYKCIWVQLESELKKPRTCRGAKSLKKITRVLFNGLCFFEEINCVYYIYFEFNELVIRSSFSTLKTPRLLMD